MKQILFYVLFAFVFASCSEPIEKSVIDDTSITKPDEKDDDKKDDDNQPNPNYTLNVEVFNTKLHTRVNHNAIYFKDAFWIYGGHKVFSDSTTNDILRSYDGITWETVKEHAPWTGRRNFNLLSFKNKLWIIAGKSDRDANGNKYTLNGDALNRAGWPGDIWNSDDGINWNKVADHGPWETRLGAAVGVFKDKMYLIGGQSLTNWHLYQDIYETTDGQNWNKVGSIPNDTIGVRESREGIGEHTILEFNNQFILFGGERASSFHRMDWVLSSSDALNWKVANKSLPWDTETSLYNLYLQPILFKDKVWVVFDDVLYKSDDCIHWEKALDLPKFDGNKMNLSNPKAIVKGNDLFLYGSYVTIFGTRDTTLHIIKITAK